MKTITLQAVWDKYGFAYSNTGASEIRLGWRTISSVNYKYNSWLKFDISQVTALHLRESHIVSAKLILYLNTISSLVSCRIHPTLKPATSSVNWSTYNGTSTWGVPGGEGDGIDIGVQLTTHNNFSQSTTEIPLSGSALLEIVNTSNGIVSLITTSPQATNKYIVAWGVSSSYPPLVLLTYHKPSANDVVII